MNQVLNDYDGLFSKIKKVNLLLAEEEFEKDKEKSIKLSGILLIKEFIEKKINTFNGESFSIYIDLSTLISTLSKKQLLDYLLITNKGNCFDLNKINKYYFPIYKQLQELKRGLYYQKKFFLYPTENRFYASSSNGMGESGSEFLSVNVNDSREEWVLLNFKDENDQLVYYDITNINIDYNKFINSSYSIEGPTVVANHKFFHNTLDRYFLNGNIQKYSSHLLSIPIIGAPAILLDSINKQTDFYQGQGAVFIYIVINNGVSINFEPFGQEISYLIKDITYNYLFFTGLKLAKTAQQNAIKSAAASIMARNMSHNLGSHILSYVKDDLTNPEKLKEKIDPSSDIGKEYLRGLGKLINYIRKTGFYCYNH